ncbi:MAG: GNAT family N-acetyltransferase [Anaerolineae bacterium]
MVAATGKQGGAAGASLHHRACGEDDYWRIRSFLREVFLLNGRREHSWHVARLDYWRWHFVENLQVCDSLEGATTLWETAGGEIAAVLHAIGRGDARLHVHADFRTPALEEEMLAYAEAHLAVRDEAGRRRLYVPTFVDDELRREVLVRRGYTRSEGQVHHWHGDLALDAVPAPAGYALRSMGDLDEHPARSWASWRAFHADEPDEAYDGDWSWYANVQRAPLYRRDLDVVAVAPDGGIAAFCTIYYDDVTRSAVSVLVGTAAEHWRRGLGRAVMTEGLRRAQAMGCTRLFANAYDPPADALYGAVLGTKEASETWYKALPN